MDTNCKCDCLGCWYNETGSCGFSNAEIPISGLRVCRGDKPVILVKDED